MKAVLALSFSLLCMALVECRYPYEDTYRSGDIVPYAVNGRRTDPRPLARDNRTYRRRDGYGGGGEALPTDYYPQPAYKRGYGGGRNSYLRPRGLGGYKSRYGGQDYDYGRYGRSRTSYQRPSLMYSNDEYGDYGDSDTRYE